MRTRLLPAALIGTALVLVGAAVVAGVSRSGANAADVASLQASPTVSAPPRTTLTGAIDAAQTRLKSLPKDYLTWAQLGSAYVQQARVTGDPSYYPKSEGALRQSLLLAPDNNAAAMLGMGSLSNARHEFRDALAWGLKAQRADPYSSGAYGVLNDAYTQLGDYAKADDALQKMLNIDPSLSSFSRASYSFEERGDVANARASMQRALAESTEPADVAFCRYYLGELEFNTGHPAEALAQYRLALKALPTYDPALAGAAKAEAALGQNDSAVRDYTTVVNRVPQPEYILEYGQLLETLGRADEARVQYELLASIQQLFAANGVVDDLTSAVYEADHGSPDLAVEHGRAEWQRRHSVLAADALAWALHRNGQDTEALHYADIASSLGWRNATFAYHRGMIRLALGDRDDAREELSAALRFNPYFSLQQAPKAVTALDSLGGAL